MVVGLVVSFAMALIYYAVFSLFLPNLSLSQSSPPYIFCPVLRKSSSTIAMGEPTNH